LRQGTQNKTANDPCLINDEDLSDERGHKESNISNKLVQDEGFGLFFKYEVNDAPEAGLLLNF